MLKYLTDANLKKWRGKTALLRVDMNIEPGGEENSYRLKAILPTIQLLLKYRIKVLILSHRGRPTSKNRDIFSLKPIIKILEKRLGEPIKFIDYNSLDKAKPIIQWSKSDLFCLENLRFWPGEDQNSPIFAKKLAVLGDFYVNEAFAVSHRKNASISFLPRFLPHYAGLQFAREIDNLSLVMHHYKRPLTVVIGGAKAGDKLGVIKFFAKKADYFLLGGAPANTFFKAQGLNIRNSVYDATAISTVKKYLRNKKIILPTDLKIGHNKFLDIGPRSLDEFIKITNISKTVIWNGPVGLFEEKGFERGSYGLARAIARNKGFTLVGGGETTTIILKLNLEQKIKFVSTGGGAMLDYLSGKRLPGLEALKK